MKIEFLDIAQVELDEAIQYYEFEQKDLGKRFLKEIKVAILRIKTFPFSCQLISENSRQCLVKSFPFSIIYQIRDEGILILSVSHQHRKPYHWKDRIKNRKI